MMISVTEAVKKIDQFVSPLPQEVRALSNSLGYVLSEDVCSKIDMPPFNQSAMDGYAVNGDKSIQKYILKGEVKAGDTAENIVVNKGEAVRVFTGAIVPEGCNSVFKQEDVSSQEKLVIPLVDFKLTNIRKKGEQIFLNEIAAKKGTVINAGVIGHLTTLGVEEVNVFKKPIINIVVTGSELVSVGQALKPGKIYESNSVMLSSALKEYGFQSTIYKVKDDYNDTFNQIKKAVKTADVVLISGGISVGNYDFVKKALDEIGVEEKFYKLKQKPGKPLFFGMQEKKLIFALPGNPAAALTSFYVYVLQALAALSGRNQHFLKKENAFLADDFSKSAGKTLYLKGNVKNDFVSVLPGQSSAMLGAFSETNCLIILDENTEKFKKGDSVNIFILN